MNTEIVRVTRVLEYVGPRAWVEKTLDSSAVKGIMVCPGRDAGVIREATIGTGRPEPVGIGLEYEDGFQALLDLLVQTMDSAGPVSDRADRMWARLREVNITLVQHG